ncbi:MAG: double-strand break repair protein AddB, partial [Methylobacteriaceae bacterium]|nr:double-strand break repair protein AddB [Methylobacteriaceae bacterium]
MPGPHVFSISPGAHFLPTLADALLAGDLVEGISRASAPLELAKATIYLPTRRAAGAFAETLATRLPGGSVLLPHIVPLGQLDAVEASHLFHADEPGNALDPDLPPAIGDVARRMILTRLVLEWGRAVRFAILSVGADGRRRLDPEEALLVATAPADAWQLAGDLGDLIDELTIERIDWGALAPLGVGAFDDYWRITLDFLTIAIRSWPAILAERGLVDRATRQIRLVESEAARLRSNSDSGPVIAAGSTGTHPATAELMAAIAHARHGAVVLPGLDKSLDEASWRLVGGDGAAGHPQSALSRLLPRLGISRDAVVEIGDVAPSLRCRARFLTEALRPADMTNLWRTRTARLADADVHSALADIALIEAADERAEALALAIALREAMETPGCTAALVTPDRDLARRVRAELGRWSLEVEDSAGEPLGRTPLGSLARLVMACPASRFAPVDVLALLNHPLARLGQRRTVSALELGVLRGTVPRAGLADISSLIAGARAAASDPHAHQAAKRIGDATWGRIEQLLVDLRSALDPLASIEGRAALGIWLAAHRAALLAVSGKQAADAEAGSMLADLYDTLGGTEAATLIFTATDYAAFFDRIIGEVSVRSSRGSHPRIKILGLLEARLLSPDVML